MERASSPKKDSVEVLVDEIISQIDKNRGKMTPLEFDSLLIQNRLEKYYQNYDYTDEEEIYRFIKAVIELLGHYLEFLYKSKLSDITTMPLYRYVQKF